MGMMLTNIAFPTAATVYEVSEGIGAVGTVFASILQVLKERGFVHHASTLEMMKTKTVPRKEGYEGAVVMLIQKRTMEEVVSGNLHSFHYRSHSCQAIRMTGAKVAVDLGLGFNARTVAYLTLGVDLSRWAEEQDARGALLHDFRDVY